MEENEPNNNYMYCPNCGHKIKLYDDWEFRNILIGECKNCKNRYATEKIKEKRIIKESKYETI